MQDGTNDHDSKSSVPKETERNNDSNWIEVASALDGMNMSEVKDASPVSSPVPAEASEGMPQTAKRNLTVLQGQILSHSHGSEWKVTIHENPASLRVGILKMTPTAASPFAFSNVPVASIDWSGWQSGDTATFQFRPGTLFGTLTMIHDRTNMAYSISTGWCAGARHCVWATYSEGERKSSEEVVTFSNVKSVSAVNAPEDILGCLLGMIFLTCVVWMMIYTATTTKMKHFDGLNIHSPTTIFGTSKYPVVQSENRTIDDKYLGMGTDRLIRARGGESMTALVVGSACAFSNYMLDFADNYRQKKLRELSPPFEFNYSSSETFTAFTAQYEPKLRLIRSLYRLDKLKSSMENYCEVAYFGSTVMERGEAERSAVRQLMRSHHRYSGGVVIIGRQDPCAVHKMANITEKYFDIDNAPLTLASSEDGYTTALVVTSACAFQDDFLNLVVTYEQAKQDELLCALENNDESVYDTFVKLRDFKKKTMRRLRRMDKLKRSLARYCESSFFMDNKGRSSVGNVDHTKLSSDLIEKLTNDDNAVQSSHRKRRHEQQLTSIGVAADPQVCRSYVYRRVGRMPTVTVRL